MKNCDIVFLFLDRGALAEGAPSITIASNLTVNDQMTLKKVAATLLEDSENRKNFANLLEQRLSSLPGLYNVTEQLLNTKGVVGNITLALLKSNYPNVKFPPNFDNLPEILLVSRFNINGKKFLGRVLEDGKEVFVIQDDYTSINKFASYLSKRLLIELYAEDIENNEELSSILETLKKRVDKSSDSPTLLDEIIGSMKSNKDLLILYLTNKSLFKNSYTRSNDLDLILKAYTDSYLRIDSNTFTAAVINSADKIKDTYLFRIDKLKLMQFFKEYHKEEYANMSEEELDQIKKFFSRREPTPESEVFFKNFIEKYLRNKEEVYWYDYVGMTDKYIEVRLLFPSFENITEYTYPTLINQVKKVPDGNGIENGLYRGHFIYHATEKNKKVYYCSLNPITMKADASKRFDSIEAVKKFIDDQYNLNLRIDKTSNIGFKLSSIQGFNIDDPYSKYVEGTIVKSIGVTINSSTKLCEFDLDLFSGNGVLKPTLKRMKEKYSEYIGSISETVKNKFNSVINTTEKAGVFLYLINERLGDLSIRSTKTNDYIKETIDSILDDIKVGEENPLYFYIDKYHQSSIANHYRVIRIDSEGIEYNESYQRPLPAILQLDMFAELLTRKFGLEIKILEASEIPERIGLDKKAWIENGVIYLNGSVASTTDLMHEYSHLFLGVLKSTDRDFYYKLIDKIRTSKQSSVISKRLLYRELYPNLSDVDLNEEVLAELFGLYLSGKNLVETFNKLPDLEVAKLKVKELLNNLELDENPTEILKGRLSSIFANLLVLQKQGKLSFGDNSHYRKASRLIEKWIENKELLENC